MLPRLVKFGPGVVCQSAMTDDDSATIYNIKKNLRHWGILFKKRPGLLIDHNSVNNDMAIEWYLFCHLAASLGAAVF